MPKPLILNQETGHLQTPDKETAPKRSWRKGDGGYNAKFEWEGATIYIAFPEDWNEVSAQRNGIVAKVRELQEALPQLKAKEASGYISTEETEALEAKNDELAKSQIEFTKRLIDLCVIGWTGAPFPFSVAERDALPIEIKSEWVEQITQVSQLSQKEADFLHRSFTAG